MRSKETIYNAEFLKKFTLAVIQVIERQKLGIFSPKEIVDADLIPELSEELLIQYALGKKLLKEIKEAGEEPIEPVQKPEKKMPIVQKPKLRKPTTSQPVQPMDDTNGFKKIEPLLEDYSVSRIRCPSANKPLTIIRSGQQQPTRIVLNQTQITQVFEHISELAHIPLIEGPFKVTLKDYSVNGINSKITGSKFIIQKETAYSMLEKGKGKEKSMPHRRGSGMPGGARGGVSSRGHASGGVGAGGGRGAGSGVPRSSVKSVPPRVSHERSLRRR